MKPYCLENRVIKWIFIIFKMQKTELFFKIFNSVIIKINLTILRFIKNIWLIIFCVGVFIQKIVNIRLEKRIIWSVFFWTSNISQDAVVWRYCSVNESSMNSSSHKVNLLTFSLPIDKLSISSSIFAYFSIKSILM